MPRGGARPNTGGARPGAGRPPGIVNARTKMLRSVSSKKLSAGIMPVQVMLQSMRAHWERSSELLDQVQKMKAAALQRSETIQDEELRAIEATLSEHSSFMAKAADFAGGAHRFFIPNCPTPITPAK